MGGIPMPAKKKPDKCTIIISKNFHGSYLINVTKEKFNASRNEVDVRWGVDYGPEDNKIVRIKWHSNLTNPGNNTCPWQPPIAERTFPNQHKFIRVDMAGGTEGDTHKYSIHVVDIGSGQDDQVKDPELEIVPDKKKPKAGTKKKLSKKKR
jgi:hypothetical protein